jgi:hypothetical protein
MPRLGLAVLCLVLTLAGVAHGQPTHPRRDGRGPVLVMARPVAAPAVGAPFRVRISLDTHTARLDTVDFMHAVALRTPSGDVPPEAVEHQAGGPRHRQAVLLFPPLPDTPEVRLVVRDIGGIPAREMVWRLRGGTVEGKDGIRAWEDAETVTGPPDSGEGRPDRGGGRRRSR